MTEALIAYYLTKAPYLMGRWSLTEVCNLVFLHNYQHFTYYLPVQTGNSVTMFIVKVIGL